MQIRLDPDCLLCLEMPAPPGAEDQTPRLRWLFRTRDGQIVLLKAHLLRHAFATPAVQVEKFALNVVGAWLKQKNLARHGLL